MFQIKICGVRTAGDARMIADAGADAIGLNFYAQSPRYVSTTDAASITAALPPGVSAVGVFVNAPLTQIIETCAETGITFVQLHGDEPPAMLASLGDVGGVTVIRAFRLAASNGVASIESYLTECRRLNAVPAAVLVDAFSEKLYGGTGKVVDPTVARKLKLALGNIPLVLAGGLTPGNVAAAIHAVSPAAVDTASGVESQPGVKDPDLVHEFVANSRRAFDNP